MLLSKSESQLFTSPDCLVVRILVSTVSVHSDTSILNRPQLFKFTRFFPGVVGHTPEGVVCHHILVTVLSLCLLVFLFKWLANANLLFQLLLVSFCHLDNPMNNKL